MTIVKVGLIENRELDETFFKEVYPAKDIKTEAEFRDEIKGEIKQYWDKPEPESSPARTISCADRTDQDGFSGKFPASLDAGRW